MNSMHTTPEPLETFVTEFCFIYMFDTSVSVEELLQFKSDLPRNKIQAWHPFWGQTAAIQNIIELLTGINPAGYPFVLVSRNKANIHIFNGKEK